MPDRMTPDAGDADTEPIIVHCYLAGIFDSRIRMLDEQLDGFPIALAPGETVVIGSLAGKSDNQPKKSSLAGVRHFDVRTLVEVDPGSIPADWAVLQAASLGDACRVVRISSRSSDLGTWRIVHNRHNRLVRGEWRDVWKGDFVLGQHKFGVGDNDIVSVFKIEVAGGGTDRPRRIIPQTSSLDWKKRREVVARLLRERIFAGDAVNWDPFLAALVGYVYVTHRPRSHSAKSAWVPELLGLVALIEPDHRTENSEYNDAVRLHRELGKALARVVVSDPGLGLATLADIGVVAPTSRGWEDCVRLADSLRVAGVVTDEIVGRFAFAARVDWEGQNE